SVAELFFEHFSDPQEAESEVSHCYTEATPEIAPTRNAKLTVPVVEMCVVASPDDAGSDQFRRLVKAMLPETEVQDARTLDDIVVYRERLNIALADLEHLKGPGQDAYIQLNATENFTPHSRCDIDFRG